MKTESIFKTIALAAFTVGAFAGGSALFARFKTLKDKKETQEAIEDAENMAQNFSGIGGRKRPVLVNRPPIPRSNRIIRDPYFAQKVRRIRDFYSGDSERVVGWCYTKKKGVLVAGPCKKGQPKYPAES